MKRRMAIAGAALTVFALLLVPAYLASDATPYTPPTLYPERPTITVVFPPGSLHRPTEGLSEPRKDRP